MPTNIEGFIGSVVAYPFRSDPDHMIQYIDASFDVMEAVGITVVRVAFWWNRTGLDTFWYAEYPTDHIIQNAANNGMRVYGIINPPLNTQAARWTPPNLTPDTVQVFQNFVKAMAERYGHVIEYWEILNEPNHDNRDQNGNVVAPHFGGIEYASLLRASYQALMAGFTARPDYQQIVQRRGGVPFRMYPGGTAGTDLAWIESVCSGLDALYQLHPTEGAYIDGFSVHPFSAPVGPDEFIEYNSPETPHPKISQGSLLQNIDWARLQLSRHPRVPQKLFIGEYGFSTESLANPGLVLTPEVQARYLAQGYLEAHASGYIDRLLGAWTVVDMNNEWDYWDHTGIVHPDRSPKPAHAAIANLTTRLRGMQRVQDLSWILPDGRMYLYRDAAHLCLAHWNHAAVAFTISFTAGTHIRHFDQAGAVLREENPGTATITLQSEPNTRFLEVTGGTIATINGVRLTSAGVPTVTGTRLKVAASRASAFAVGSEPQKAFDGSMTTLWNAGTNGSAWLEATFAAPAAVRAVTLRVAQLPVGLTNHELQLQINGVFKPVHRFNRYTSDGMTLAVQFSAPYANVAKLRVVSTPVATTRSNPAWFDVSVYQ